MFQKLSPRDRQLVTTSKLRLALRILKTRLLYNRTILAIKGKRYPRFYAYWRLRRISRNPRTFESKMWHRLANDRRPILTTLSDKFAVREFVKERVGAEHLTHLYGVWEKGDKVNWENLPREFVAKATHGVGGSLIVRDTAPRKAMKRPPKRDLWDIDNVNPADFSRTIAEEYFNKWVRQRYNLFLPVQPSWSYGNIPPKVIFEELLQTSVGLVPEDYKFFCFDGKCHLIEIDVDRFGDYRRDFYTPEWEPLDVHMAIPNSGSLIPKSANFKKMIDVAERLSEGFDFVTVDLYDLPDRIVFGEISFYNGGGHERFSRDEVEDWVGSLWKLPNQ